MPIGGLQPGDLLVKFLHFVSNRFKCSCMFLRFRFDPIIRALADAATLRKECSREQAYGDPLKDA